ncbi:MAG: TlyA family RNA methyltransferase [Deltaproteobacteria bacterium]|nr:TlyA family RNA methyltransferase [Deltaproteobacteria bacterium]
MHSKRKKQRIDELLVEQGLAPTLQKAQAVIMAGCVLVDDVPVTKAGQQVNPDANVRVKGDDHPYVGRGGVKLEHALKEFQCDVKGKICMDVGASTGGFTDCLLKSGAAKVYAVDVGYGQLATSVARDSRVVIHDRTNIRTIDRKLISDPIEMVVIDVSFISLEKVFSAIQIVLADSSQIVALIKPQFELGKESVGKGGIIKDPKLHEQAVERVRALGVRLGWREIGVTASPIKGAKGNSEFLICFEVGC